MTTQVSCSHCGKKSEVPARLAGRKVKCPSCTATIAVPIRTETLMVDTLAEVPEASRGSLARIAKKEWAGAVSIFHALRDFWGYLPRGIRSLTIMVSSIALLVISMVLFTPSRGSSPAPSSSLDSSSLEPSGSSSSSTTPPRHVEHKPHSRVVVIRPPAPPRHVEHQPAPKVVVIHKPAPRQSTSRAAPSRSTRSTRTPLRRPAPSGRRSR